jgi:hypothetical protein
MAPLNTRAALLAVVAFVSAATGVGLALGTLSTLRTWRLAIAGFLIATSLLIATFPNWRRKSPTNP